MAGGAGMSRAGKCPTRTYPTRCHPYLPCVSENGAFFSYLCRDCMQPCQSLVSNKIIDSFISNILFIIVKLDTDLILV
jgi:hypothetical protein